MMYFTINNIPQLKKLSSKEKRELKLKVFKEIRFGGKTSMTIILSVILSITVGGILVKFGVYGIALEVIMYLAFGLGCYLGYLYILNSHIVPKIINTDEYK